MYTSGCHYVTFLAVQKMLRSAEHQYIERVFHKLEVMQPQDINLMAPWPPAAILQNADWVETKTPELVRRFQVGLGSERTEAFSAIYNRYSQGIWEYIYRNVDGADAEAKDIFGQVWLIALEELITFQCYGESNAEDPLRAWLFCCASNRIKQYHREKHANISLDLVEGFVRARLSGEDTSLFELFAPGVKNKATQLLYGATRNLNKEEKQILRLRYYSNMTFAEIGEHLDKTEGAVKVQHHRLLKKLRTLLEG